MGAVVYGYFKGIWALSLVAIVASIPAKAEDLLLPYLCTAERGEVRLHPAPETSYRISGRREEQIFTQCPAGTSVACTNLMIHRFSVTCGTERITWARIAHAARSLGIDIPRDLPPGFAPVTPLGGRFVLPGLTRFNPLAHVSTQELSPDSVVDRAGYTAIQANPSWVTVVKSEMRPEAAGGALRVAATVTLLMLGLFASSLVASGRWRAMAHALQDLHLYAAHFKTMTATKIADLQAAASARLVQIYALWKFGPGGVGDETTANALLMAHARLAETELSIAMLSPDLLLREVLNSELARARDRLSAIESGKPKKTADQMAVSIRALLREFDRISRIAQSAAPDSAHGFRNDDEAVPRSVVEAYQVLGLNSNAAPEVAKKLVDALRMSWHPDYAEDEGDRRRRESRMKQINAAWDIVNGRREAA